MGCHLDPIHYGTATRICLVDSGSVPASLGDNLFTIFGHLLGTSILNSGWSVNDSVHNEKTLFMVLQPNGRSYVNTSLGSPVGNRREHAFSAFAIRNCGRKKLDARFQMRRKRNAKKTCALQNSLHRLPVSLFQNKRTIKTTNSNQTTILH